VATEYVSRIGKTVPVEEVISITDAAQRFSQVLTDRSVQMLLYSSGGEMASMYSACDLYSRSSISISKAKDDRPSSPEALIIQVSMLQVLTSIGTG